MIPICLLAHVVCLKMADMWEKSEAVAEIGRRGMLAPRVIRKYANAPYLRADGGVGEVGCSWDDLRLCTDP